MNSNITMLVVWGLIIQFVTVIPLLLPFWYCSSSACAYPAFKDASLSALLAGKWLGHVDYWGFWCRRPIRIWINWTKQINSKTADPDNLPSTDFFFGTEDFPLYLQPNIAQESRRSTDPDRSGFSFYSLLDLTLLLWGCTSEGDHLLYISNNCHHPTAIRRLVILGEKKKLLFSVVNTSPANLVFQMGRGTDEKNEPGIYGRNLARGKFGIVRIERYRFSLQLLLC